MNHFYESVNKRLNQILKMNQGLDQSKPAALFELRTIKPNHTEKIKYVNLGPLLGKNLYRDFLKGVNKEMQFGIDSATYSRMCVEVSEIDNTPYIEFSLNEVCQLPIAGSQYHVLKRDAESKDMDLIGYINSLNFILNDYRNYK